MSSNSELEKQLWESGDSTAPEIDGKFAQRVAAESRGRVFLGDLFFMLVQGFRAILLNLVSPQPEARQPADPESEKPEE